MKSSGNRIVMFFVALMLTGFSGFARAQELELPRAQTLAIGRVKTPPVLDGKLDEWGRASFMLGNAKQTLRRPGRWNGTKDSSAAIWLAWDEQYFYLAADVADDKLMQARTGAEPWQGDTLELFFNLFPGQQRIDGFWQIALIPPLEPGEKLRVVGAQKDFENVEGTAAIHPGGYTLECRIPWKNLTGFVPASGVNIGFQLILNDRDDKARKSILAWYPSAITYAHPQETNTLVLKEQNENSAPAIFAGPVTEVVTTADSMVVNVMTEFSEARKAMVKCVRGFSAGKPVENEQAATEIKLNAVGDRIVVGEGKVNISTLEDQAEFAVSVMKENGDVIARSRFITDLQGKKFVAMKALFADCQKRAAALPASMDEVERDGLRLWIGRIASLIGNEARTDTITRPMLAQMNEELAAISRALSEAEQGRSAYQNLDGSFVRGYRSPLTNAVRGYAMYVPPEAKEKRALPLIVLLHPIFADERFLFLNVEQFKSLGAIVYQAAAYRQFDWSGISAAETWAGLEDVLTRHAVDRERIYLVGIHGGGRGAWQLAMARPDLFAAVAPLYSGIDTRPTFAALRLYPQFFEAASAIVLPSNINKKIEQPIPAKSLEKQGFLMQSLATRALNMAGIPTWSVNGEDDADATAERLAIMEQLRGNTHDIHTRYDPGAAHGSMPAELHSEEFWRWIMAQHRKPIATEIHYTATDLRNNSAWWLQIDRMHSPLEPAKLDAKLQSNQLDVVTKSVDAFALRPANLPSAMPSAVVIDEQQITLPIFKEAPAELSFWRDNKGKWQTQPVPESWKHGKRHGHSGPIHDFQFGRFLLVFGTQGSAEQNAAMEKLTRKFADWNLGAMFESKADKDVTENDLQNCHIIAVGTPQDNAILKRASERDLVIKWIENGMSIGDAQIQGPGAGACVITPNPLAPSKYMVVVTATDPAGYGVWNQSTGCDWVMGKVGPRADASTGFNVTRQGWFDSQWQWQKEFSLDHNE